MTPARTIGAALVATGLVGCPKPAPAPGAPPDALRALATPPSTVEYIRHTVAGPFPMPPLTHREEWSGPTPDGDRLVWDVATYDVTGGGRDLLETVRVYLGPDGYGFLGTVEDDGTFVPWEPPQQVLPADPRVGATWSATHVKAGRTSVRTCEIQAANHCTGGVVVVCDSRKEHGLVVLRDHFCPGEGWIGFEALQQVEGQPSVRMWSEHVVRDGRPLTEIPVQESE